MSSGALGLAALAAIGVVAIGGLLAVRYRDQLARDAARRVFEVRFPRTVTADQVRAFLATLAGLASTSKDFAGHDTAVLEVVGSRHGVSHRVRLPASSATFYAEQLRASVPGATITEIKVEEKGWALPTLGAASELRLVTVGNALSTDDAAAVVRTILAACLGLAGSEIAVWQWVIGGGVPTTAPEPSPSKWRALVSGTSTTPVARKTTRNGLIRTTARIGATASTPQREAELVARLRRAAASVSAPSASLVPRLLPDRIVAARIARGATPLVESPVLLSREELTALVGWPIGGPALPGLALGGSPQLPTAPDVPHGGRVLGRATVGTGRFVGQSVRGALEHSVYIGPSGSGKTWLAAQVALGDIAAGRGALILDPKGGLVRAVLDRLPEAAISRTVVIDPADQARPVPLPLLANEDGGIPELAADTLIGLLRHRYRDLGPRSTDILSSSLYALARMPGSTIFDLFKLWGSPQYRATVAGKCADDPALSTFFAWFNGLSASERNFVVAAPMNKIRPLLQRPALRNVIAAPRATFTLSRALADNLVVLVTLPEGFLGTEAATILGQVLLARLWSAIQRRSRHASSHAYFVTIDEAPRFVDQPTDLGDVLAQAREYGVGFTLIAQTLAQFPVALRSIAVNSARTKVAWQASADDARRLADEFGPMVTADMMQNLAAFDAIGRVSIGGAVTDPFTFRGLPLDDPIPGRADAVRAASRERWGIPREEIEASFTTDTTPSEGAGPVGRRTLP